MKSAPPIQTAVQKREPLGRDQLGGGLGGSGLGA